MALEAGVTDPSLSLMRGTHEPAVVPLGSAAWKTWSAAWAVQTARREGCAPLSSDSGLALRRIGAER